ncbi:DUF6538 domain-containing protein [Sphingomonas parapaucimobilis]|uniref:DUF6538 domain-containing protein n=1 Tax=Sphingomonas parapaucimobilis TaxID=28213 RepID=UPI0034E1A1CB
MNSCESCKRTIHPKPLKRLGFLQKSLLVTTVCYNRSEAKMSAYLLKRDGGTYYFRRSIPLAQRQRFGGRREWVRSLGTKDRKEAKRLIPACLIAFDK